MKNALLWALTIGMFGYTIWRAWTVWHFEEIPDEPPKDDSNSV